MIGRMRTLVLLLTAAGLAGCLDANSFDAEAWRAAAGITGHRNPRNAMVADLAGRLKPGMDRSAIVALLGAPDAEGGGRLVYGIGASPCGIDYAFFVVTLDGRQRLGGHAVTRG